MRSIFIPLCVFALLAMPGLAVAQDRPVAQPAPVAPVSLPEYEIGPGDVLSIRVFGVREFDQSIRVSNSGRIRIPYVGIVFAAGMTTIGLEREIADKIKEHELVTEPSVRVQITQQRARPVHVVGEVVTPGQFVITGEMYLLDLITRAGGLSGSADATAILYRRGSSRPSVTAKVTAGTEDPDPTAAEPTPPVQAAVAKDSQVIPINLDDLRDGKRPDLNIPLQGGDVLYVPRRLGRNIYIIGDVKVPGAYSLPRRGNITAAQAITYAGGPLLTAKNGAAFLMRHDESGVRQAIPIDFVDIIKGKKPDIQVQADDIIFIPNSPSKTIAVSLLNQIPRLIQQLVIF